MKNWYGKYYHYLVLVNWLNWEGMTYSYPYARLIKQMEMLQRMKKLWVNGKGKELISVDLFSLPIVTMTTETRMMMRMM